jgi:hypothetical protein
MMSSSGYRSCACRDCMELAIAADEPALCSACEEAGCEPDFEHECCAVPEEEDDGEDFARGT